MDREPCGADIQWCGVSRIIDQKIAHEREIREVDARARALALEHQADEYKRRLDDLNHAHADARRVQLTLLGIDRFERFEEEDRRWKLDVTKQLASDQGARTRQAALLAIGVPLLALVVSVGVSLLKL